MSRRNVPTRPRRTKLYDCNYNMGERLYKPTVDALDRKYFGSRASEPVQTFSGLRGSLADDERLPSPAPPPSRRSMVDDFEDEFDSLPTRKPLSSLMGDFDSVLENRSKSTAIKKVTATADDEEDEEMAASMRRIRAAKAARLRLEEELNSSSKSKTTERRQFDDLSEKVLSSVGIKSDIGIKNGVEKLEDDPFFKKRTLKMTLDEEVEAPSPTKWSAMKSDSIMSADERGASERARKSRARLADLEDEMEELVSRSVARDKKLAHLKALMAENEAENSAVKQVIKVRTAKTEKKTVTF